MRRREFVALLGSTALAWPIPARAQQGGKLATIGLLGSGTAAAQSQWTAAFVQRLRELGWTEGRNVTIEYRWAEGRSERFAEFAAEFVRLKVDVILTHNTRQSSPQSRQHQLSRSCLRRRLTRLTPGWSLVWPGRVVTSPACRARPPILLANGSNFYARSSPVFVSWRSCPNPTIPTLSLTCARLSQQHADLGSKLRRSKFDEPRISHPPSRNLRAARRRSISCLIRYYSPIAFASTLWRSVRGCRRCICFGSTSKQAV